MRLADFLGTEVVRLADEYLDLGDLVMLGLLLGVWQEFEREASRGLWLERSGHRVDRERVAAKATEFRYARKLVSAADFTAWLTAHSLTPADLSGVLARALMRAADRDDDAGQAVTDDELSPILHAEATCGGVLDRLATAGIERVAAAHQQSVPLAGGEADGTQVAALVTEAQARHASGLAELGDAALERHAERIVVLEQALAQARAELARDEQKLGRALRGHALDWIRLSGHELLLGFPGAARESRLLVIEEGLSLHEVATLAGTELRQMTFYLEQVPDAVRGQLASLRAGELAEPWEDGNGWHVFELRDKLAPSLGDSGLRDRLLDELLTETFRRHAAGRAERTDAV